MAQTLDFFRAKEIYGLSVKAYKKPRKQILEKTESNQITFLIRSNTVLTEPVPSITLTNPCFS